MSRVVLCLLSWLALSACSQSPELVFQAGGEGLAIERDWVSRVDHGLLEPGRPLVIVHLRDRGEEALAAFFASHIGADLSLSFGGEELLSGVPVREGLRLDRVRLTFKREEVARRIVEAYAGH